MKSAAVIKAKRHVARARALSARSKSPLKDLSEDQIIAKIRKDREFIWESKHAARA